MNEVQKGNKIAIFDIVILRTGSRYSATVYRKPAAPDRYIHHTSVKAWKDRVKAKCTYKLGHMSTVGMTRVTGKDLSHLLQAFF